VSGVALVGLVRRLVRRTDPRLDQLEHVVALHLGVLGDARVSASGDPLRPVRRAAVPAALDVGGLSCAAMPGQPLQARRGRC
jgi:hypothetical protein